MRCYECAQLGEPRDAVGLCQHCSAALCTEHIRVVLDPVIEHLPVAKEGILPKKARLLLCEVCKAAYEQNS